MSRCAHCSGGLQVFANRLQCLHRKYAKRLGHIDRAASRIEEHQAGKGFLHRIGCGVELRAQGLLRDVLNFELLSRYLLCELNNLQWTQRLGPTQLDNGILGSRRVKRSHGKFRDILK